MKIELPSQKDLTVTNDEDPLKYYYLPIAASFYKKRLKDVLRLLGNKKYKNLLDIGFGCGLLFPELSKRCENLYGLEVHDKIEEVEKSMRKIGIKVNLEKGSVLKLPYKDNFFDAIVSVSTLEHIEDLETASNEILRVLGPGGTLVLGFPARNEFTDMIFRMCGNDPRKIHPSGHKDILGVFGEKMKEERRLKIPMMYYSVRFVKK